MSEVLSTNGLTKKYKEFYAASDIGMHINKGDIYGFIGKNGAGKTTLMKMVCGLIVPSRGEMRLFGSDDLSAGRRKIGSVIESPALFDKFTAEENLTYYTKLRGCAGKADIKGLLELVGLSNAGKKRSKNFSLGMKQRLSIAVAMIVNPEFLVLDEPINGLDPAGIREVRELILRLNKEREITILISSHILGELGKVANRYGVIRRGELIDEFSVEELGERTAHYLRIDVGNAATASRVLREKFGVQNIQQPEEHRIYVYDNYENVAEINKALVGAGVDVSYLAVQGEDLETYFVNRMEG